MDFVNSQCQKQRTKPKEDEGKESKSPNAHIGLIPNGEKVIFRSLLPSQILGGSRSSQSWDAKFTHVDSPSGSHSEIRDSMAAEHAHSGRIQSQNRNKENSKILSSLDLLRVITAQ